MQKLFLAIGLLSSIVGCKSETEILHGKLTDKFNVDVKKHTEDVVKDQQEQLESQNQEFKILDIRIIRFDTVNQNFLDSNMIEMYKAFERKNDTMAMVFDKYVKKEKIDSSNNDLQRKEAALQQQINTRKDPEQFHRIRYVVKSRVSENDDQRIRMDTLVTYYSMNLEWRKELSYYTLGK